MTRVLAHLSLLAIFAGLAFSQSDANKSAQINRHSKLLTFTRVPRAASLHERARYSRRSPSNPLATMLDLIHIACGMDAEKIMRGPAWLEYDTFDLTAKMPPKTTWEIEL